MTITPSNTKRTIYCQDALSWLKTQAPLEGCSIITSMPDFSEFPKLTLQQWKEWFTQAAALVLSKTPENGVAIFYQSDIKVHGTWVDKAYLCQKAAEQTGHELLWHKVACRSTPGRITFGKPSYSHLLCFSKRARAQVEKSTADVLPEAGDVTWARGMGVRACLAACRFIQSHTETCTIVDPFCGHGTVLAIANELGMDAIGVELSPKRAKKAGLLRAPGFKLTLDTRDHLDRAKSVKPRA
jgi:hypothetical protein